MSRLRGRGDAVPFQLPRGPSLAPTSSLSGESFDDVMLLMPDPSRVMGGCRAAVHGSVEGALKRARHAARRELRERRLSARKPSKSIEMHNLYHPVLCLKLDRPRPFPINSGSG